MLKLLTRTSIFLGRQSKKSRQTTVSEVFNHQNDGQINHSLHSQYHKTKLQYQKLDQLPQQQKKNDKELEKTMSLVKSMMKNNSQSQQLKVQQKNKVDIKEKLSNLGTPQALFQNKQTSNTQSNPSHFNYQSKIIYGSHNEFLMKSVQLNVQSQARRLSQMTQSERQILQQYEGKKVQQELLLDQIMKHTNQTELDSMTMQQPQKHNFSQKEKHLMLRQQKIVEALRQNQDPSEMKYKISRQDILKMNYSDEIIQKAKEYKVHELAYFKELLVNQNKDTDFKRNPINKRRFKDSRDEESWNLKSTSSQIKQNPPYDSYNKAHIQQGLLPFQDVDFYKHKSQTQLSQRVQITDQDQLILKQFQQDLGKGNQFSDIFLDKVSFPLESHIDKKLDFQDTSFSQQSKQVKDISNRLQSLGIDYSEQEIKDLCKLNIFQKKQLLEQQQNYQKYLHKKQKQKNMKKQLRQIHRQRLRDDLNFNHKHESPMTLKQLKESNDIEALLNQEEMLDEHNEVMERNFVKQSKQEKLTQVHHIKTFKAMQGVLHSYFQSGLFNRNISQLSHIQICQVIPNRTNTVLHVFWNIQPDFLQRKGIIQGSNNFQMLFNKEKKYFQKCLMRQGSYISGKMTQLLRLRYGPQIRFHFDQKTLETKQAVAELRKYLNEIAMVEIEEYSKKGYIDSQQKEVQYFQKLLTMGQDKIHDFNSRKQLLSKKYQKKKKNERLLLQSQFSEKLPSTLSNKVKSKRTNPIFSEETRQQKVVPNSSRKSKKDSVEKFWDSIQLL